MKPVLWSLLAVLLWNSVVLADDVGYVEDFALARTGRRRWRS